jgi:exopolysaccharide biosynthesis polyprenyl glycosylphosphotransferase
MVFSRHKTGMAVLDGILIFIGFHSAFWFVFASGLYGRPQQFPLYYVPSIVLITTIFLIAFQLEGLYKYQAITNPIHQLQSLLKCYLRCLAAFILIIFFLKTKYIADSRLTIGLGFLISFLLMAAARALIVPKIFYYLVKTGKIKKRILIMGAGEHGSMVCTYLDPNPESFFDIIGFCDDFKEKGTQVYGKEIFGNSYELEGIVSKYHIEEIILAISNIDTEALLDLIDRCKKAGLVVHVVSDLFSTVTEKMEAEEFSGLMTYRIIPRETGIVRLAMKRAVDLIGSSLLLTLLSPLFLIIAWAIKQDSEGPVFYKSEVIGREGKPFVSYKFRSMISSRSDSQDEMKKYEEGKKAHLQFMEQFIQGRVNGEFFIKDESRITKVGRFLRKHSLDELPQLLNVFRGDMSLIGPRFCSPQECRFYKPWHKRRFQVKPGMTGLWQVRGRSEVSYDDMVILDLYYIQNYSLLFDLEILLRTVSVVLTGKGSRIGTKENSTGLKELVKDERTFCRSENSIPKH